MARNYSNMTDLPLAPRGKDSLGADNYVTALANFISRVETPMTISIQGPWGSGKTSFMYSLAAKCCLKDNNLYPWPTSEMLLDSANSDEEEDSDRKEWLGVWVNTWQYSLLKEDSSAQVEVLKGTIDALNESVKAVLTEKSATWYKFASQLKDSVGELALAGAKVGIASMGLNPVALNDVSGVLNKGTVGPQKFRNDLIHVIQQYKDEIRAKNKKFKGFIFFIDDMDRLEPVVAVQILSLLKNLFDVPDCVFVLAIDYEVVVKGLEKKFGKPSDTVFGQTNNREFRSYFDKIIQLTFRVPTDQLDLNQYLRELLGRINFCGLRLLKNEKFIGNFSKIIEASCGRNPRSIKRLLNSLSLVKELVRVCDSGFFETIETDNGLLLLSALSALQAVYPRVYDKLRRNPNLYSWKNPQELIEQHEETTIDEENEIYIDEETLRSDQWQIIKKEQIGHLLMMIREWSTLVGDGEPKRSAAVIDKFTSFTSTTDAQEDSIKIDNRPKDCGELIEALGRNPETKLDELTESNLSLLEATLRKIFESVKVPFDFEFGSNKIRMKAKNKLVACIFIYPTALFIRFGKGENFTSLLIGDENVKNAKEYVKQTKELADNSSTINAIRDRLKIIANRKSVQRWSTALNGESDEADDEDAAMCDAR